MRIQPYKVSFILNGEQRVDKFEATSAGRAFAKCLLANPGCELVKAWREGKYRDGEGYTEFEPPKIQRQPVPEPHPFRTPRPNEKVGEFPFYDQVRKPA